MQQQARCQGGNEQEKNEGKRGDEEDEEEPDDGDEKIPAILLLVYKAFKSHINNPLVLMKN